MVAWAGWWWQEDGRGGNGEPLGLGWSGWGTKGRAAVLLAHDMPPCLGLSGSRTSSGLCLVECRASLDPSLLCSKAQDSLSQLPEASEWAVKMRFYRRNSSAWNFCPGRRVPHP